ncbi:MAG: hypothetical protein QXE05_03495 [Nitrososphaeria archaeon]
MEKSVPNSAGAHQMLLILSLVKYGVYRKSHHDIDFDYCSNNTSREF